MTKNPIINALSALAYIVVISLGIAYIPSFPGSLPAVFAPIGMLSLFTFSAATMGYLFLGQPLQLYLDGQKKEGVQLFVRTLLVFGGFTILALVGTLFVAPLT